MRVAPAEHPKHEPQAAQMARPVQTEAAPALRRGQEPPVLVPHVADGRTPEGARPETRNTASRSACRPSRSVGRLMMVELNQLRLAVTGLVNGLFPDEMGVAGHTCDASGRGSRGGRPRSRRHPGQVSPVRRLRRRRTVPSSTSHQLWHTEHTTSISSTPSRRSTSCTAAAQSVLRLR
jgi:hypothetical protein